MSKSPRRLSSIENNPAIRRQLLQGLHDVHEVGALRAIAEYLADPEPAVCETAVNVLVQAGTESAANAVAERLHSSSAAERAYAIDALGRLGLTALNTLTRLLGDVDEDVRKCAADTLGVIGDPLAIPALAAALTDADTNVAAAAAEGLGKIGAPEAVAALDTALRTGTDWVRISALTSLGALGGRAALRAICSIPANASLSVQAVAAAAAGSAGQVDPPLAARFLARFAAGPVASVADAALLALATVVQRAGRQLLDGPQQRSVTGAAVQRLPAPLADVRLAAIQVLAHTGRAR